jgi:hypothetical protein
MWALVYACAWVCVCVYVFIYFRMRVFACICECPVLLCLCVCVFIFVWACACTQAFGKVLVCKSKANASHLFALSQRPYGVWTTLYPQAGEAIHICFYFTLTTVGKIINKVTLGTFLARAITMAPPTMFWISAFMYIPLYNLPEAPVCFVWVGMPFTKISSECAYTHFWNNKWDIFGCGCVVALLICIFADWRHLIYMTVLDFFFGLAHQ